VGTHAKALYLAKDGEKDARGVSPLHYAVNLRQEEIVRVFVEQGAMVDLNLLVRWLTSDRRVEWGLVERLVQQLQITDEKRHVLGKDCLGRLPGDAPLGDNRLLTVGTLKGHPKKCTQWAEKDPSVNPFALVASRRRSGLEWMSTKKAPVRLHVCQADAASCSHPAVIKALGDSQNMELLSTPFVEAVIRHTWSDYKAYALFDIIVNLFVLVVALYASALVQSGEWTALEHAWAVIALGCGIGKRCVEEAAQLYACCAWRKRATLRGSA
jgi:hypothetical protein